MGKSLKRFIIPLVMVLLVLRLVGCSSNTERKYTVKWSVDGEIVETDTNVLEGTKPSYNGQVPTKEADNEFIYTFNGWSTVENQGTGVELSLLPKVTKDVTYYACFIKEAKNQVGDYTITWKDADGEILGTTVVDKGKMPSRDLPMDTSEWKYTGWSPSIVMATSNATYTAIRTKQVYTVVWQDTEGEVLKEEELQYGVMPSYELPKDTEKWTYIGWDPVVSMVTKDVVYTAIRESKIYKLKNQVLVDNEKFKIVILEASEDIFSLFTVTFYLENKTENQDLVFFVSDAVVNGYVSGAWLAHILEPKTNKTEKMWFDTTAMGKIGITTFDKIELYTTVSDGDDNSIPDLLNEIFTIYPTGLSENEIVVPNRPTTAHEKVIADNSMMTLIFIDTYEDEIMGDYILQMYLENKTTDKKLAYDLDYAVINGYFIYSFWGPGLQPKTKQVSEVCLSLEDIEFAGISSVDKIELYFRVYDSDDFWGPNLLEEKITLYPTGLTEEEIVVPPRPTNENEYVVVSNEQVTFIIIDSYMDEYSNYIVELYFENKTDTPIIFDWNDVLVNELSIDPYFFMDIPQKTKGVRIVRFYSNDLRENNITKVETIKFLLDIYDKETWDTIFIETHTYNVPQAE